MPDYPPIPTKLMPSGGGGSAEGEPYYPPVPRRLITEGSEDGGTPVGPGFDRQGFVKSYANMVAHTWADDQYLQLLLGSPVPVLAKAGLPTVPGAVVRIIQHKLTGMGRIDEQVECWIEGHRTGLYDLYLPMKPDDVDVTLGGRAQADGDNSCCCTPCCCCT